MRCCDGAHGIPLCYSEAELPSESQYEHQSRLSGHHCGWRSSQRGSRPALRAAVTGTPARPEAGVGKPAAGAAAGLGAWSDAAGVTANPWSTRASKALLQDDAQLRTRPPWPAGSQLQAISSLRCPAVVKEWPLLRRLATAAGQCSQLSSLVVAGSAAASHDSAQHGLDGWTDGRARERENGEFGVLLPAKRRGSAPNRCGSS
jgi:hypothetical protein